MHRPTSWLIYLKLLLMALFWGGTFIAGRDLAGEIRPFAAAFLRFTMASTVLVLLTLYTHRGWPKIQPGQWLPLLLLGLSGVFAYNAFFFKGLEMIEAGRAAVIVATNPVLIALFAALLLREKLDRWKVAGILLSVFGAIVVITDGEPAQVLDAGLGSGELYIFGCVLAWVVYTLVGRIALRGMTPLVAVTWSALLGTLMLLPMALLDGLVGGIASYPPSVWLGTAYLGLFGTVLAFVWYYQGIRAIGSTRAGQFINFVPVSGVALSAWLLDEPLTPALLIGLALVSVGVYLTNRPTAPSPDPGTENVKSG
jgi:drug/metabolite transporter (DMT)-like permease